MTTLGATFADAGALRAGRVGAGACCAVVLGVLARLVADVLGAGLGAARLATVFAEDVPWAAVLFARIGFVPADLVRVARGFVVRVVVLGAFVLAVMTARPFCGFGFWQRYAVWRIFSKLKSAQVNT